MISKYLPETKQLRALVTLPETLNFPVMDLQRYLPDSKLSNCLFLLQTVDHQFHHLLLASGQLATTFFVGLLHSLLHADFARRADSARMR